MVPSTPPEQGLLRAPLAVSATSSLQEESTTIQEKDYQAEAAHTASKETLPKSNVDQSSKHSTSGKAWAAGPAVGHVSESQIEAFQSIPSAVMLQMPTKQSAATKVVDSGPATPKTEPVKPATLDKITLAQTDTLPAEPAETDSLLSSGPASTYEPATPSDIPMGEASHEQPITDVSIHRTASKDKEPLSQKVDAAAAIADAISAAAAATAGMSVHFPAVILLQCRG